MTDLVPELIPPTPDRQMSDEEAAIATGIYAAVMSHSRYSERALQAAEYQVGVSDLGYCSERTRRMLGQEVPEDSDLLPAFLGTAMGDHVERAIVTHLWPEAVRQVEVTVPLPGSGGRVYNVPGHPDIIRPDWGVLDGKTSRGLTLPRRVGPSQQQQFQRHLYCYGASLAGLLTVPLDQAMVGNYWFDRAGDDRECYVQVEPFDPQVIEDAASWLDDVVYAYVNGTEARKEPPREVCQVTCGFFPTCRMWDTDVTGLLTDEQVLAALDAYQEGLELEKRGRKLKDQAKPALLGINGSDGKVALRWIHVNPVEVPAGVRKGHERINITKLKG